MVLGAAIKIIQTVYKFRHGIYAAVTAQDRAIKGAFVGTRVPKAAQYGWRTGAAGGGLIGSIINTDTTFPGNGVPETIPKRTTTSQPNKTRGGYSVSRSGRYKRNAKFDYCARQSYSGRSKRRTKRMYN